MHFINFYFTLLHHWTTDEDMGQPPSQNGFCHTTLTGASLVTIGEMEPSLKKEVTASSI